MRSFLIFIRRLVAWYKCISNESRFNRYRNLDIGDGTQYTLDNLDGIAPQLISIGRDCVIAPKAVILTHDACLLPTTGKYIFNKVIVGNRVFIGYGAVIMPGVVIGNNVIIGSNAVVTKNIPDDSVVAGVPGKIIGKTSELALRRQTQLIEPVFDWRCSITPEQIIKQQNVLVRIFEKGNSACE